MGLFRMAEQKQESAATNFSGVWKLHKNENCDAFHKSQGIKWAKRKILNNIKMELTINHNGNNIKCKISTSITSMTDEYIIGAKETETVVPMTKDTLRVRLYWKDPQIKQILVMEVKNITQNRMKIMTLRTMPTKDTMIDVSTNTNNIVVKRVYKRIG